MFRISTITPHTHRLWGALLVVLALASCTTTSHTAKNKNAAEDEAFRARAALSPSQQRDFDKVYLEAMCQKLKGNTDAAYEMLEYALELNPKASEVLYELANMQLQSVQQSNFMTRGDSIILERGKLMLRRAYDLEPSNPYFRSSLAEHYIRTGEYEQAVPLYELIAEEKPTEQNITILSRLYEVMQETDKAISTLTRLEQYQGYTEETAVEQYRIYMQAGQTELAEKAIQRLVDENPTELRYRVMLGDVFMDLDKKDAALEIYNDVLAKDPNNTMANQSMLGHYLESGQRKLFHETFSRLMVSSDISFDAKGSMLQSYAVQCVQEPEKLDRDLMFKHFCEALSTPQDNPSLAELCMAFMEVAEINENASPLPYETVIAFDPTNIMAIYKLAQYYVSTAEYDKLAQLCNKAKESNPDDIILAYYEGASLIQLGQYDSAIAAFERGISAINDDTDTEMASELYAALGDLNYERRQLDKAFKAYDSSLLYNGKNVSCLNNYAYFLCLEGRDLEKALTMSQKAISLNEDDPTLLDTYAWALYCNKQYTQARIYIDKTIESLSQAELQDASSASLYDHAGDIYFRIGERQKAVEFWTLAYKISDDAELKTRINVKIKNKRI